MLIFSTTNFLAKCTPLMKDDGTNSGNNSNSCTNNSCEYICQKKKIQCGRSHLTAAIFLNRTLILYINRQL